MFALLGSEGMKPFYQIVASFPTIFFTILLIIVVVYWLLAILGAVEISVLDFDMDIDTDMSSTSAITGFMMRLGLHGVPATIIVSLIAIFGWLISYYIVYFFFGFFYETFLRYVLGVPVLFGSLYAAVMLTAFAIRPMRTFFQKTHQQTIKRVLGQVAIVRSAVVNNQTGEAMLADGGAGLILKVRTGGEAEFQRGDRVVLLEYIPEQFVYRVISEQEFLGLSSS